MDRADGCLRLFKGIKAASVTEGVPVATRLANGGAWPTGIASGRAKRNAHQGGQGTWAACGGAENAAPLLFGCGRHSEGHFLLLGPRELGSVTGYLGHYKGTLRRP